MAMVLRVFRWSPEAPRERFQAFPVETGATTTVLDALVEIQRAHDPTLAFRYACRVGMCGSCGMVVNGRETWACRLRLARLGGDVVTVRPLYHFPLVRDLVVDMTRFVEKMRAVGAVFRTAGGESQPSPRLDADPPAGIRLGPSGRPAPQAARAQTPLPGGLTSEAVLANRAAIDAAIQCIGCGACVSACTIVRWDPKFPGPAALNRAFTLIADGRDGGTAARWEAIFGEDGVWRCHTQGQCAAVCPMELSPTDSILRLRRKAARTLFSMC
jgi:fumarate reductase iron-sulfur subunit